MMIHQSQDSNQNGIPDDNGDEKTPFTSTEDLNGYRHPSIDTGIDDQRYSENMCECFEHQKQSFNHASFKTKFKYNKIYREKYLITMSTLWAFVVLGWTMGQFGPSFLDLQIITAVTLSEGSGFMTGGAVGYLIGSLISGVVFDKMTGEKTYLMSFSMLAMGVIIAIIPWCVIYELMIVVHVLKGIAAGASETTGNALLISLWGSDGKTYMQALYFFFSIGGIVSPFATSPFLVPDEKTTKSQMTRARTQIAFSNTSFEFGELTAQSFNESRTNSSSTNLDSYESQLYIAFSITAGLALSAGGLLFVMALLSTRKFDGKDITPTEAKRSVRKLTRWKKVVVLIFLMSFMSIHCAIGDGFNGYLTTFCVKGLSWTKYKGSVITSVVWASFAAGRFFGIFFVRLFKPVHMIFFMSICICIGFIAFLLSGMFNIDSGIWVSACVVGCSMSIIFPSFISWVDESILPVSGIVASCFFVAASCGAMINPVILGFLMGNFTPMWYPYLLVGESVLKIILFIVSWAIAKRLKTSKHTYKETKIEKQWEEELAIENS